MTTEEKQQLIASIKRSLRRHRYLAHYGQNTVLWRDILDILNQIAKK